MVQYGGVRDAVVQRLSKEERVNAWTHGLGCGMSVLGLAALAWMAAGTGDVWLTIGVWVFGISLVMLYASSTLYHLALDPVRKRWLRTLDHISIFLLIAGTYTPLLLVPLRGALGWTLLWIIWGIAALGIVLKLWFTGRFGVLSTALYLGMGWLVAAAIRPLVQVMPSEGMQFLVAGGLAYTGGTVFYAWKKLPYHHGIWHVCVLAGSVCHYFAVFWALFL